MVKFRVAPLPSTGMPAPSKAPAYPTTRPALLDVKAKPLPALLRKQAD
jgi:hypothetical protein